jgi:outer membrane protein assembly factor BamB
LANEYRFIITLGMVALALFSCKKKDTPGPDPVPVSSPVITSLLVTDYCARKVTINGDHFNAIIYKDSIFFGSLRGSIDSANPHQLFATYPEGDMTVPVTVYSNGLSATSDARLTIATPTLNSFSPIEAGPGTIVTIEGENFNQNSSADSVFFNGVKAEVVSVTSTHLKVVVPKNASSGRISLRSNCKSASFKSDFKFSNQGVVYACSNTGTLYAIDIASATAIWSLPVNSGYANGPTYENGSIFIGSSDVNTLSNNYMFALNASTGAQVWKVNAGPWDQIGAVNNGVLYEGSFDKNLYAFKEATGEKIWNFTAGDYFDSGGPTYYNGKLYARNDDSYFYCIDAATGALVWKLPIWPGGNPAAVNGLVFTAAPNSLYALDANTGATVWRTEVPSLGWSSPTVVNGVVYIGSGGHQVFAINASTGDIIWRKDVSWWVHSAITVANNLLYVNCGDGLLEALNTSTGSLVWARAFDATFGAAPVVANGVLYVGDDTGKLNALNATTGATLWTFKLGNYPMISSACVVDAQGQVYHGGDSGNQQ